MHAPAVAVLFGGRSVEHEISVITGIELINALDCVRYRPVPVYIAANGKWYTGGELIDQSFYRGLPDNLDRLAEVTLLPKPGVGGLIELRARRVIPIHVFIPAFHGQYGEDGPIQGLFELAGVPYTSCEVLASALAMNKYLCKSVLRDHGVPVLPCALVNKNELSNGLAPIRSRILSTPGLEEFPLFVKPCNLGSSIGIGVARDEQSLNSCLVRVFKYDRAAIIEPCVTSIFEINVSVLEGDPPIASVVEIPGSKTGVLTYEEKYLRGGKKKGRRSEAQGMASLARSIDPETLPAEKKERVKELAVRAFQVLNCSGLVRFDFIVDSSKDELYFNELNPIPGSMAYYLWSHSNPQRLYTDNINHLIDRAIKRHAEKESLQHDVGFKALFR